MKSIAIAVIGMNYIGESDQPEENMKQRVTILWQCLWVKDIKLIVLDLRMDLLQWMDVNPSRYSNTTVLEAEEGGSLPAHAILIDCVILYTIASSSLRDLHWNP